MNEGFDSIFHIVIFNKNADIWKKIYLSVAIPVVQRVSGKKTLLNIHLAK